MELKQLQLPHNTKIVYDVEPIRRQQLLLKGIGRYCKCGCGKHILSNNIKKEFFGPSCRRKYYSTQKVNVKYSLTATISLKLVEGSRPHYNIFVYPIKGHRIVVPIYEESKELWNLCKSFAKFRIKSKEFPLELRA